MEFAKGIGKEMRFVDRNEILALPSERQNEIEGIEMRGMQQEGG